MAGLRDEVQLDVDAALRSIDRIEAALTQSTQSFRVELANALDILNRADTTVRVDVDTTEAVAAIDRLGQDTTATVTADVVGEEAVDRLNEDLDETRRKAEDAGDSIGSKLGPRLRELAAPLAAIVGVEKLAEGIFAAVNAASDLAESGSKAAVVFGDSVGQVQDFAEAAAGAAGLSQQAALEATGTFGNLLTSMGLAREEAARTSVDVVQLGADLASFNNLEVTDALEKLRSGLVGEIEPLRSLGINFNAAQVEAKALELGLRDANGEVSEAAKVQARLALIMEQSVNASGDFARTSDGLANQQRILKAEIQNTAAELGGALLPTVLELVQTARDEWLPALLQIAERGMPLVAAALRSATTFGGGFLDVIVALSPLLEVLADILDSIPAPLLSMVGAFVALNSTIGRLNIGGLVSSLQGGGGLAGALGKVTAGINPLTIALGVGAAAFTVWSSNKQEAKRRADDFAQAIQADTDALNNNTGALNDNVRALVEKRLVDENQIDNLRKAGVSLDEFTAAVTEGGEAAASVIRRLQAAGQLDFGLASSLNELSDGYVEGKQKAEDLAAVQRDGAQAARDQITEYRALTRHVTETNTAVADADAVWRILFDQIRTGTGSLADLAAASQTLGASSEDIQLFADTVREAQDNALSAFTDQIPTALDALGTALDNVKDKFSLKAVIEDLDRQAGEIKNFYDNVAKLTDAGLTSTVELVLEKGPVAGAQLAAALAAADQKQRQGFEASVNNYRSQADRAVGVARDLGTRLPGVTEQVARDVEAAFERGLDLAGVTGEEAENARVILRDVLGGQDTQKLVSDGGAGVGEAFGRGIIRGIDNVLPELRDNVISVGGEIIGIIQDGLRIESPSKEAIRIGELFVEGLAVGLLRTTQAVEAARELADSVVTASQLASSVPAVVPAFGQQTPAVNVSLPPIVVPPGVGGGEGRPIEISVVSPSPELAGVSVARELRNAMTLEDFG